MSDRFIGTIIQSTVCKDTFYVRSKGREIYVLESDGLLAKIEDLLQVEYQNKLLSHPVVDATVSTVAGEDQPDTSPMGLGGSEGTLSLGKSASVDVPSSATARQG